MIEHLNKVFDHRNRLGIMTLLLRSNKLDFNEIKSALNLTDGNLSTHAKALEVSGYIDITKQFVNNKPRTTYVLTEAGRKAFEQHIKSLLEIISLQKK